MSVDKNKARVRDLRELRRLLQPWFAADTAAPGTKWEGAPPSTGHCAAVALIVQATIGGAIQSTRVDGVSHWFNRIREADAWLDVDLTGDQFGREPIQIAAPGKIYGVAQLRVDGDVNLETVARAALLAKRAGLEDVERMLWSRFSTARK